MAMMVESNVIKDNADELRLKAFDALLWQYNWLYVKQFAYGGVNRKEFEKLKNLFVEACQMAKVLLIDFVSKYDEIDTDDFGVVLERAEHWRVLHCADRWKSMYCELLPRVKENRITPKDKDKIFSAYDLLKIPNYSLAAWFIIEKEKGVTGKDNPDLLRKICNYLSWQSHGPFWYEYPGITFATKAEIWEMAEKHDYGDIHPDVWEGCVYEFFEDKMEEYMSEHDIHYPQTIPPEIEDRFTSTFLFIYPLFDEREICILSAMKGKQDVEILYFCIENGKSKLLSECITPVKMVHTNPWWTLVGEDKEGRTKEYVVRQILDVSLVP